MRLPTIVCSSLLLLSLQAGATVFTVKQAGGGNFTTIQACATTAKAGDTCVVFAGTYPEHVSVASSGTAGSPITFQVNPGDTVLMQGFEISSKAYIIIGGAAAGTGFVIQAPSTSSIRLVQLTSANHIIIQNNTIGGTPGGNNGGQKNLQCVRSAGGGTAPSSFITVQNNLIQWCGLDTSTIPFSLSGGIRVEGDHWLIQNNTLAHLGDGVSPYGPFMVIRNNTFGPWSCADVGVPDGPSGSSCDFFTYHTDAIDHGCGSSTAGIPFSYSLVENNVLVQNSGPNGHFGVWQAGTCAPAETNSIVRYNSMNNVGAFFVLDNANSGLLPFVKLYNNTIANMTFPQCADTQLYGPGVTNTAGINNIHYNSSVKSKSCPSGANVYTLDANSQPTFTGKNNLAFQTGCTTSCFTGTITSMPGVVLNKDPLFVNASINAFDFHLQPGSPAIGAGANLTNVAPTDSGSGTALVVNDAAYFSDGAGGSGTAIVSADWIRVGASTTVQIASINYSTNVITLANSIIRSPGDPVFLFRDSNGRVVLTGAAPDIGAFPSGIQFVGPPLGLTVIVQ